MSQEPLLFGERTVIKARAMFLSERLDLKAMETTNRLALSPLVVTAGDHGCLVLFRYGAIVQFGLTPMEEVALHNQLKPIVGEEFAKPQIEDVELRLSGTDQPEIIDNGIINLKEFSIERVQLVADVLAKSVVLAHYEARIAEVFDTIEPIAVDLKVGRGYQRHRELMRYIGDTLLIQQKMVGRVEMQEKPELLWDHPDLERTYTRLQEEYDVRERHGALEAKLRLIWQTVETMHDLIQNHRSHRTEWYIVILIVVEIMLTLYQMFIRGGG